MICKTYNESEVGNKFKLTPDQASKLVGVGLFKEREIKCIPEEAGINI